MKLKGYATLEQTAGKSGQRQGVFHERRRPLYSGGPLVSLVGFGSYRVGFAAGLGFPQCRDALEYALRRGVNLIDTSTNYGNGQSELLIGQTLAALAGENQISREQVVLVSKAGYAQGNALEFVQQREREGNPFAPVFKFGSDLWYSLDPAFILDQLDRSLSRLGVECLDVFLIHNPEYMLKAYEHNSVPPDESRAAFYSQMTKCFEALETEVERGRLRSYGVSSNTLGATSDDPTAVSLQRLIDAAAKVKEKNSFKVVQCPLNWIEVNPIAVESADDQDNTLTLARGAGIGVLVNRPFNAMHEGGLIRLTRPTVDASSVTDESQRKGLQNWSRLAADLERLAREYITTPGFDEAPLSQLVLSTLMWQPGVSSVLCGMRRREYVADAEEAGALPSLINADQVMAQIYQDLEFHKPEN
ncbi:MAG: aldo/keto reductase [Proteobacteria bacterium]|nr:aldo/keto reductase [Pseudomonadota bacterium]